MTVSHVVSESAEGFSIYVSDLTHIDNYVLAANVAQAVTKPTNGNYVIFSSDGNFWARYGATAGTGSTTLTDGTGSELNPTVRDVRSASSISLIATTAVKVSATWFK